MALKATGLLTQEAEPVRTMLLDTCNGINDLSLLAMLWTVWHHWLEGVRFVFNFYKHWVHLLLLQTGIPPITLLIREDVNQGYPLLMVLLRITLVPMEEEIWAAYPGLITPFYTDNATFN